MSCALSANILYASNTMSYITVLQIGNVSIISEAYRRLFNFGAETLQRDYDLERAFN